LIGTRIASRYLIVAAIGGGGMAEVYKAEDERLSRPVAVKVLRREFGRDEEFVRRFENEARAAASLSHPNVVSVYDVGETPEGDHYIVMEFVDGRTLKDLVRDEGPLSVRQSLTVAAAVASALSAAHRKGIVHRDIKPENILITADGAVKVTDFGIARAASGRTIVHTGSILGSAHYFSPEQARGGYVDEKSDLYSLGCVLFELLAGRPPYDAPSPIAVALKHVQEPVPSVRKLRPGVPKEVDVILQRLLAKEPEDRYRSADAALRQLESALAALGGPEPLVPGGKTPAIDGAGRRVRRGGARVRWPLVLLVVVFAALVLGVAKAAVDWLNSPVVRVPRVIGRSLSTAEAILTRHHLKTSVGGRRYAQAPAGTVLAQDPSAGQLVKEGRIIALVLSRGPAHVQLPDVVGEPQQAATATLQDMGFRVRTLPQASTEMAGTVLAQDPKAGRSLPEGSTVTLYVSSGLNAAINMPNVVGLPVDTAAADLKNIGLYVSKTDYAPSSAPYGTVLQQSVAPGAKVQNGQGVVLTLSQGPPAGGGSGPAQTEGVTLTVSGSSPAELKVVVVDVTGLTTAFDQTVNPGQATPVTLNWQGDGRVEVYVAGQLVLSQPLPLAAPDVTVQEGP
jgi:beta-lactam-binding protein with PASTA domain/predicted Ser/Thr protein kinase